MQQSIDRIESQDGRCLEVKTVIAPHSVSETSEGGPNITRKAASAAVELRCGSAEIPIVDALRCPDRLFRSHKGDHIPRLIGNPGGEFFVGDGLQFKIGEAHATVD